MRENLRRPLVTPTLRGVHHLALCTDDMKATIDQASISLNAPDRRSMIPIGTEKPIPEIVDYRKIAIGMPVMEKMELLLSPEPGKSSQP
jgi:hypothetical protein